MDLSSYPGGDLVSKGLADLSSGARSEEALLVLIARPRLIRLGFDVPARPTPTEPFEHQLFTALEERVPRRAHFEYNSLIHRVVSFTETYRPAPCKNP